MDFAKRNDDKQALDVFARSVRGLEELVPIYDVPGLANSRYRLTGPASIRLSAEGVGLEVSGCRVSIPGYGTYVANAAGDPAGEVLKDRPIAIQKGDGQSLNVSLSRLSWPDPNKLIFCVSATEDGRLDVSIGDSLYNPLAKAPVVESYRHLETVRVEKGRKLVEVEVPWSKAELVAYPTNFGKTITGRQFNQYHFIHVDTLGKIATETGSDILRDYHDKWTRYPSHWPEMPEHQDNRLMLERFDPKKHK